MSTLLKNVTQTFTIDKGTLTEWIRSQVIKEKPELADKIITVEYKLRTLGDYYDGDRRTEVFSEIQISVGNK